MTEINPAQAKALARFLLTVRPDWSITFTEDAVGRMRLIDPDLETIVRVAIRGALSPKIAKPDVLAMAGGHWRARADTDPDDRRPRGATRCQRCHNIHAADAPCDPLPSRNPRIAELRAEVARVKTGLCSHGIRPNLCADHRRIATETEAETEAAKCLTGGRS